MVRIGVIGLGNMGSGHASSIKEIEGLELAAVSDIDSTRMDRFADARHFDTPGDLIRSGEVEAVVIATPHYQHTEVGVDALTHGLHVLVEKPISVHKADCEKLIAAKKGPDQVFAAMFNQRTDPFYQAIRSIVHDGDLGQIQRITWIITNWFRPDCYYASGGWRATWRGEGGGVLLNQCPHNLDLLQWIVGMPSSIRAFCGFGKYHDIEVEDEVAAIYQYPNGATGTFLTTTGEAPGTNRLEIVGDMGKLVYEGDTISVQKNEVSSREFSKTTDQPFGSPKSETSVLRPDSHGGQHIEVLQNFADAILKGTPLIAPAEEGINSVELANAMLLSAWTDATVSLPLDGAQYATALEAKIRASKR